MVPQVFLGLCLAIGLPFLMVIRVHLHVLKDVAIHLYQPQNMLLVCTFQRRPVAWLAAVRQNATQLAYLYEGCLTTHQRE